MSQRIAKLINRYADAVIAESRPIKREWRRRSAKERAKMRREVCRIMALPAGDRPHRSKAPYVTAVPQRRDAVPPVRRPGKRMNRRGRLAALAAMLGMGAGGR